MSLRKRVRHCVTPSVNAPYAPTVPAVSAANSQPSRVPSMYETSAISNAVGATLNTIEFNMN